MAKAKSEEKNNPNGAETKTAEKDVKKTSRRKKTAQSDCAKDGIRPVADAKNTEKFESDAESVEDIALNSADLASLRADKAAEPSEDLPDVPENERIKRYDVMITSERAGYRPPKAAIGAMVQQLAFRGFASPVDEAIAETWTEIYFEPGPAAHEIFLEKEYNDDAPVYREVMMRFCEKPFFCDYSDTPKRPLYWAIEIRGTRFANPLGAFRKLFLDALNLRVSVAARPAAPLPPHLTVPEDEQPVDRKKRERGRGLAGTEVEEV